MARGGSTTASAYHVKKGMQADPNTMADSIALHHFPREHYGQYRRWDLITNSKMRPVWGETSVPLD